MSTSLEMAKSGRTSLEMFLNPGSKGKCGVGLLHFR